MPKTATQCVLYCLLKYVLVELFTYCFALHMNLPLSCILCVPWRPHHSTVIFSIPHSMYLLSLFCYFWLDTRASYTSNCFVYSSVVIDVFIFLSNAVWYTLGFVNMSTKAFIEASIDPVHHLFSQLCTHNEASFEGFRFRLLVQHFMKCIL